MAAHADLSERQERILELVIDSYLESGHPIGSRAIAARNEIAWSPSTIRSELAALEQFFSAVSWVPVGEDVARVAGDLARRHRRAHSGIDDADYFIAATALVLEADLLTTNVRHFPMLPGLTPPY